MKRKIYRGVDHPAVALADCPHCTAPKGTPCRRREQNGQGPYVETHMARVRQMEANILKADQAFFVQDVPK